MRRDKRKLLKFGPWSVLKSAVLVLLASFLFSMTLVGQPQVQSEPQDIFDLRRAAEHGDAQKQFELGSRYYTGKGVAKDHAEAMKWYCKVAEQGDPGKQFQVGFMYWIDGNNVEAAKWYRRTAEQGHLLAQSDLADMYKTGKGVPQDYVEAAKWYRSAVTSGYDSAAFSMYSLCTTGKSTRRDCADVAEWLTILANQGDSVLLPSVRAIQGSNVSQYFLGTLYAKGLGVPQDYNEAARWYRKAG